MKIHNEIPPHTHQDGYYKKKKVSAKMWRNWNPCALLVEMLNGIATLENSMEVPQKIKNRIAFLLQENTKWWMMLVFQETRRWPQQLHRGMGGSFRCQSCSYAQAGTKATELVEGRLRTRSGSLSPSQAAWSRTWRPSPWRKYISSPRPSRSLKSRAFS